MKGVSFTQISDRPCLRYITPGMYGVLCGCLLFGIALISSSLGLYGVGAQLLIPSFVMERSGQECIGLNISLIETA